MVGETLRQLREAGIPQALLGPIAARGEPAGEAGDAERA
jgi:hypothetical protein